KLLSSWPSKAGFPPLGFGSHLQREKGSCLTGLNSIPSTAVAKTILRGDSGASVPFTWALVDAEHGLISDVHYYDLVNAVGHEGASPIIRIPSGEEWMIKRALDAGAHGVMTPMCHSEVDAAKVVSYAKYPPLGTRGYGPMFAPHAFPGTEPGAEYDTLAQDVLVAVQIESRAGVENVAKIAEVDGVDVIFIGPFDLSKQMGVERGGQEHEAATQKALNAAHAANKKCAIFCTDGAAALIRAKQGFDMISVNTDVGVLKRGMANDIRTANGEGQKVHHRQGY
ncbi:2 4-dihydroxyhept-2-ene-1, partial [Colletotrichum asianum]